MTMVLKKTLPNHRTRSLEDDTMVGIDPTTRQLVVYENARENNNVKLDTEVFLEHNNIEMRYDLLDCYIDVCSPEVHKKDSNKPNTSQYNTYLYFRSKDAHLLLTMKKK